MNCRIRDLQLRLQADGRNYVIEVCAPGVDSDPAPIGPFDVHILADVPTGFDDRSNEPEHAVRHILDYVRPLVPVSVLPAQWSKIADVVLAWVCAHQDKAPSDRVD